MCGPCLLLSTALIVEVFNRHLLAGNALSLVKFWDVLAEDLSLVTDTLEFVPPTELPLWLPDIVNIMNLHRPRFLQRLTLLRRDVFLRLIL